MASHQGLGNGRQGKLLYGHQNLLARFADRFQHQGFQVVARPPETAHRRAIALCLPVVERHPDALRQGKGLLDRPLHSRRSRTTAGDQAEAQGHQQSQGTPSPKHHD